MKRRKNRCTCERVQALLGLAMVLAAGRAVAQVGPLPIQDIFFTQAAARGGNYLDALAGAVYTTNATLTPNGTPDTLALLGLSGNTAREDARLDYRLAADIAFVEYLKQNLQTRPSGYLDGEADYWIVPSDFSWFARETYNQILINPILPGTPDNLESLNYLTTGPRLAWQATLQTRLSVEARYSWITSTSTAPGYVNLDNQRYGGTVKLDRALSSSSAIYLAVSADKVNYKDVANTDFTLGQALAGYTFTGARTVVDLSGSYAKVKIGGTSSPYGGYIVNLSRLISPRQRLSFHALQANTDNANLFRLNFNQPVVGPAPPVEAAAAPLLHRELGFGWRFQGSRTSFDLAFTEFKDRYIGTTGMNTETKNVSAFLVRQLSPTLNFDVGAAFLHTDFSPNGYTNEVTALTDLRWQGAQFGVRFFYAYGIYTPGPGGYVVNQVGVLATYALSSALPAPGGAGVGAPAPAALLPTSPLSTQAPAPQVPE